MIGRQSRRRPKLPRDERLRMTQLKETDKAPEVALDYV